MNVTRYTPKSQKIEGSKLYRVQDVEPINDTECLITYTTKRVGILFWEDGNYEQERIKIGLPYK